LAQLHVFPAYLDPQEAFPGAGVQLDNDTRTLQSVKVLRRRVSQHYDRHLKTKLESIISNCKDHRVDVLILPEYAVGPSLLPYLRQVASESEMCIIAASHMVSRTTVEHYEVAGLAKLIKADAGAAPQSDVRKAASPVFIPRREPFVVWKEKPSKFESFLVPTGSSNHWTKIELSSKRVFLLGVFLCKDALELNLAPPNTDELPRLLVIPSYSRKWHPFYNMAATQRMHEIAVCYVNEATYGNSKVFGWCHREHGSPFLDEDGTIALPSNEESLMIVDLDIAGQFGKNSTTRNHQPLNVVSLAPLLYTSSQDLAATKDYPRLPQGERRRVIERLTRSDSGVVSYKAQHYLDLLNGGIDVRDDEAFCLESIQVDDVPLWQLRLEGLETLYDCILEGGTADAKTKRSVKDELQALKQSHPRANLRSFNALVATVDPVSQDPVYGREDDLRRIGNLINDDEVRLICVSGMRGIGKTTLLRQIARTLLPPTTWKCLMLRLTEGAGFPRFVLTMAELLGLHCEIEQIADMDAKEGRQLINDMLAAFDELPAACLMIDDWYCTMTRGQYRDSRLAYFLTRVMMRQSYCHNKVVLTSWRRLNRPEYGVENHDLRPLNDESIRSIIQWYMRNQQRDGSPLPTIPIQLIRLLHGNPLAAKILPQLLDKFPAEAILDNAKVLQRFQDRLIPQLLDQIQLEAEEERFISYLSVFNIPAPLQALEAFSGDMTVDLIDSLTDLFVVEYDQDAPGYYVHPLVREHFLLKQSARTRADYSQRAAKYYEQRVDSPGKTPSDVAEFVSHLAQSFQLDRLDDLRYGQVFVDELRPVARMLFRSRNWENALRYYQVLDRVFREPDIKFHIGLCHARLDNIPAAERAITEALRCDPTAYWVLAGYGEALVSRRHLDAAQKNLVNALELCEKHCHDQRRKSSIYQSLGKVHQKRYQNDKAEECYRKAIEYDPESAFAHVAYAWFLLTVRRNIGMARDHLEKAKSTDSSLTQFSRLEQAIQSEIPPGKDQILDDDTECSALDEPEDDTD